MLIDIYILCPAPRVGALSDDARLTSVWRLPSDIYWSHTSGLSREFGLSWEQSGLGRLKLAQR